MPTYAQTAAFMREWSKLTAGEQAAFRAAVALFISDLKDGRGFRPSLRIHNLRGENVWPLTFELDSRATFTYGDEIKVGHQHIVWHHVGTHDIYSK